MYAQSMHAICACAALPIDAEEDLQNDCESSSVNEEDQQRKKHPFDGCKKY